MDADQFDHLAHLLQGGSRRGLWQRLAALSLGGVAVGRAEEADAKKRKKKKRKKKKCKPQSKETTCAGKCGSVKNNCHQTVNCGACSPCDVCESGCPHTSVQAAIDDADDGDTIAVCAGTYTGNITIDKDLILSGAGTTGQNETILQGTGENSVIRIATGTTVTLQDLIVLGGHADQGGGIESRGDLEIVRCLIDHNQADSYGGGIFHVDGDLTISASTIRFNTAGTNGGGIFNSGGTVELESCVVIANEATAAGGVMSTFGGVMNIRMTDIVENRGGGVVASLGGAANLFACTVRRNTTNGNGAGIGISGGTVELTNNTAVTDNEAGDFGGGIFIQDWGSDLAELTLDTTSRVTGNEADLTNPDSGGGIYRASGTVTLANEDNVTGNFPNNCEGDVPLCSG